MRAEKPHESATSKAAEVGSAAAELSGVTGTVLAGVANAESYIAFSALRRADVYVRLRRAFRGDLHA